MGKDLEAEAPISDEQILRFASFETRDLQPGWQVFASPHTGFARLSQVQHRVDRELAVSPLLREIDLEPPRWIPLRLPIEVWDAFSHLQ